MRVRQACAAWQWHPNYRSYPTRQVCAQAPALPVLNVVAWHMAWGEGAGGRGGVGDLA